MGTVSTFAVFVSAGLLFLVQPMVAKMLLPALGGAPAVWNTCMLFFQADLLVGYLYAHALTRYLKPRTQVLLHSVVILVPLAFLPIRIAAGSPPAGRTPVAWLLSALAVAVGVPFAVLAASGPLFQRWFAQSGREGSAEPYSLYAASNLGSLVALLGYPFILEPSLRLSSPGATLLSPRLFEPSQGLVWSLGYLAFIGLAVACGVFLLRTRRDAAPASAPAVGGSAPAIPWRTRGLWLALAFAPSSLMLGTTQFLTTDVATVPLLWVLPLSLYLLAFVLAFSRRFRIRGAWSSAAFAVLAVAAAASIWLSTEVSPRIDIPLHLLTLFAASLVCLGRLWDERPAAERLTEFYLWIALGGCLGGVFNALVAPVVFRTVAEYPLVLVLACFFRQGLGRRTTASRRSARVLDFVLPAVLAGVVLALHAALAGLPAEGTWGRVRLEVGIPALLCLPLMSRPVRFGLGLAVLLAAGLTHVQRADGLTLYAERTFFGVQSVRSFEREVHILEPGSKVARIQMVPLHLLRHGTTKHGSQVQDPRLRRRPTSYFHPSGPMGDVFRAFHSTPKAGNVGIVGLGAGAIAAYGEPGQKFTFYEIDPAVERIARDERYFTFLGDCRAELRVVLGDGRASLAAEPDGRLGILVIDAFSSDSIPVHLLTREAVELYFRKLAPDGLLVLHISSRFFDLRPVVEAIAADLGLAGLYRNDYQLTVPQLLEGKDESIYALLARDRAVLDPLLARSKWEAIPGTAGGPANRRRLWTDEFSSVLGALR